MKHTPLPWDDISKYPGVSSVGIFAGCHYIASVGNSDDAREQTEANAAFIVKAVNSHEALVNAAKRALSAIDSEWGECEDKCDTATDDCCTSCLLRAALQSASGSPEDAK